MPTNAEVKSQGGGASGVGTSGYSGYSGTGVSGYSGFSGKSGFSGISGFTGYSGFTGISGYSGVGISGFSGYSGNSFNVAAITFIIDGGGSTITTGIKGDLKIPFACTINEVTLLADQTGSVVIDIWKDTYANYAPTVVDTITASAKPTLSSAIKSEDNTLTGWTTSISLGDILRFNVDSISTCTRITISLKVTKI